MSTAASIYFSHTHYDIMYVQIQNISTTTAVLTRFVVVITCSRVQINRKVVNPVQNIPGYDVLLLAVHYVRWMEKHIKTSMLIEKNVQFVHIKTSMSTMEKPGMLVGTRFSLSVEDEQADTRRDGQICLAKANFQA